MEKRFEITKDNYEQYKELYELKEYIYSRLPQKQYVKKLLITASPFFILTMVGLGIAGTVGYLIAMGSICLTMVYFILGCDNYYKSPYRSLKQKYSDIKNIEYGVLKDELERVKELQKNKTVTFEYENIDEINIDELLNNEFYTYKEEDKIKLKEKILTLVKSEEILNNVIEKNKYYYEEVEENIVSEKEIEKVKCKIRKMSN